MDIGAKHVAAVAALCAACGSGTAQDSARQAGVEACEAQVNRTVQRDREGAQQVQFVGAKRTLSAISDEETGIAGEGRYRSRAGSITPFTYSCVFNPRTGEASGVVLRESAAAAAPGGVRPAAGRTAAAGPPIASTDACESAVAQALRDKHPRTSRIAFGSDTRTLRPAADARTSMEGEGAVERAPGMSAVRFSYSCLFDARSGKVERVQTSD